MQTYTAPKFDRDAQLEYAWDLLNTLAPNADAQQADEFIRAFAPKPRIQPIS